MLGCGVKYKYKECNDFQISQTHVLFIVEAKYWYLCNFQEEKQDKFEFEDSKISKNNLKGKQKKALKISGNGWKSILRLR